MNMKGVCEYSSKKENEVKPRNYGIDFFRLVSMFMVVILHVIGHGGVGASLQTGTIEGEILWGLRIACYSAVNCFALISGYVGRTSRHRYTSLIELCLQAIFYCVLFTVIYFIYRVLSSGEISIKFLATGLLPQLFRGYWYFSAYFCLFFFMPLLNTILEKMSKKELTLFLGFIFIAFSCAATVRDTVASLNSGYSFLWLMVLYLIGGYISKHKIGERLTSVKCFLLAFAFIALTICTRIILLRFSIRNILVSYTSPTVLLTAVFFLMGFSRLKVSRVAEKIIKIAAPAAFGVYLIHEHPIVKLFFIEDAFSCFGNFPIYLTILLVLGTALAIFTLCIVIELARRSLFKVLKIKNWAVVLESSFKKIAAFVCKLLHINLEDSEEI